MAPRPRSLRTLGLDQRRRTCAPLVNRLTASHRLELRGGLDLAHTPAKPLTLVRTLEGHGRLTHHQNAAHRLEQVAGCTQLTHHQNAEHWLEVRAEQLTRDQNAEHWLEVR